MSTDLISQLQQNSLASPNGLNQDTLAVAGRANSRKISTEGRKFTMLVNGNEVASSPVNGEMDIIFVKMAHTPCRTLYDSTYTPGKKAKIICWASDARTPDADVKNKQAPACNQCPHSIKGAAQQCKLTWRTAVVTPAKPKELIQLILSPKSCFGDEVNGGRPFQTYIRYLAASGINNNAAVTKMYFDPAATYQKLLFAPSAPVPMELIPVLNELATSEEAQNYVKLSIYQEKEEEDMLADPVVPNVAPAQPASVQAAPQADVVSEPVLRETTIQQPQAPKADVSSIINKWSVKS
jgi:hypothetical protein